MSSSLFESELPSDLPNPQFIARAGATNRVVLLLGKPYEVKCAQPIVCMETSHSDVEVSYYVNGGTNGGTYAFTLVNGAKLLQVDGGTLPVTGHVAAAESFMMTARYEGRAASGGEGDIVAKAEFVEDETGQTLTDTHSALTAVQVELTTQDNVNECIHRHVWGVRERIICECFPMTSQISVKGCNGGEVMSLLGVSTLVCPLHSSSSVLRITCGTCEYVPATTTVEPTMLNARNARQISYNVPIGWPGGAGFEMDVFVEPDHVSFQQLSFMEDVSSGDTIDGYFTNVVFSAVWHHSEDRGALVWHNIQGENFFFHDLATMGDTLIRPWAHGTIVWRIPIRWRDKNETATPVLTLSPSINQTFTMSDSGCLRAAKYNYWVERNPDGTQHRAEGVQSP